VSWQALTLWQPFASLCRPDAKTIETRDWARKYRGPLLIHAAVKWSPDLRQAAADADIALREFGLPPLPDPMPRGCVVAVASLVDVVEMVTAPDLVNARFGYYGPGRYGWRLADIAVLNTPIPWPGDQGLWQVPEELEQLVRGQLAGEIKAALDRPLGMPLFRNLAGGRPDG
jgi:activating signal cointegrator 1